MGTKKKRWPANDPRAIVWTPLSHIKANIGKPFCTFTGYLKLRFRFVSYMSDALFALSVVCNSLFLKFIFLCCFPSCFLKCWFVKNDEEECSLLTDMHATLKGEDLLLLLLQKSAQRLHVLECELQNHGLLQMA